VILRGGLDIWGVLPFEIMIEEEKGAQGIAPRVLIFLFIR